MSTPRKKPVLLGCSLGNCVHIAGVANFFRIAEGYGFETILLGAAIEPETLGQQIVKTRPDAVCVSYRLTAENCRNVLAKLKNVLDGLDYRGKVFFGGTPKTVEIAKEFGIFDYYFVGEEDMSRILALLDWLGGKDKPSEKALTRGERLPVEYAVDNLPILNAQGLQVPLLRHHFGLPSVKETVDGVCRIAEAEVLDVISIAPDQNAQEFFFCPEQSDRKLDGAGGVPVRSEEDLLKLHKARQCGNRPYLRIYSGTQELLKWAQLSVRTIDNAWGAIPLCWYSELDGRSKRSLLEAIKENMSVVKWYAQIGKAVEINESHHWSLRDGPDVVAVAMAYISAYVAKKLGVKQYFAQYMFNNPSFTSTPHDIAKIVAQNILVKSLEDENFRTYRQVRAGLAHFSVDTDVAKGQLGMATAMMMAFNPHIIHIVGFTEADHAASASEVIESVKIVRGVIRNASAGVANLFADPAVKQKAQKMFFDAQVLLGAMKLLGESMSSADGLADPQVIAKAVSGGLFDAPHLCGQVCAAGLVRTLPKDGGCAAVDANGKELSEYHRLREPARRLNLDYSRIKKIIPFIEDIAVAGNDSVKFLP
jgi:hypothetical protein